MQTVEQVLQLYREKHFDFNVQHFHEKLRELHGIELSYTWVKTALQTAGLVKRRKKPGSHRKRRPRRPLPGMTLHIDGSEHRWFGDGRYYELIVVLDDATSEIYYTQLVEAESTRTVMTALREVVETRGLFCHGAPPMRDHYRQTAELRGSETDCASRRCSWTTSVFKQPRRELSSTDARAEKRMCRFKSARHAQRFVEVHGIMAPHFRPRRHLFCAADYGQLRSKRFRAWNEATGTAALV
jgi:hypothetical protein